MEGDWGVLMFYWGTEQAMNHDKQFRKESSFNESVLHENSAIAEECVHA